MKNNFVFYYIVFQLYLKNNAFNSFSANGNIELFANNTDSGETVRDELSHLKSALFCFEL